MSSFDQKPRAKRRIRVVELWALGFTATETVAVMRDEQYRISVATVYRDRHSTDAQDYLDELIRRQLRDIAQASLDQKLEYRDKLLGKLLPQKMLAFTQQDVTIRTEDQPIDLTNYSPEEHEALRRVARIMEQRTHEPTGAVGEE